MADKILAPWQRTRARRALDLFAAGYSIRMVAARLGVNPRTAARYKADWKARHAQLTHPPGTVPGWPGTAPCTADAG